MPKEDDADLITLPMQASVSQVVAIYIIFLKFEHTFSIQMVQQLMS